MTMRLARHKVQERRQAHESPLPYLRRLTMAPTHMTVASERITGQNRTTVQATRPCRACTRTSCTCCARPAWPPPCRRPAAPQRRRPGPASTKVSQAETWGSTPGTEGTPPQSACLVVRRVAAEMRDVEVLRASWPGAENGEGVAPAGRRCAAAHVFDCRGPNAAQQAASPPAAQACSNATRSRPGRCCGAQARLTGCSQALGLTLQAPVPRQAGLPRHHPARGDGVLPAAALQAYRL
jgi:hypothetical protein